MSLFFLHQCQPGVRKQNDIHPRNRMTEHLPARIFLFLIVFLLWGSRLQAQIFAARSTAGVPSLKEARSVWANFDPDSDEPELLLTGLDALGKPHTQVYQLVDSATWQFKPIGEGLHSLHQTSIALSDFNHDRLIDVLLTGLTGEGKPFVGLYANAGGGRFERADTVFVPLRQAQAHWVDLDNDGRNDILLAGITASDSAVVKVYRNAPAGFVEQEHNLPGLSRGALVPFHFDQDARPDLYLNGLDATGEPVGAVYRNEGKFTFAPAPIRLDAVYDGAASAGDFNSDGQTDLLVSGLDWLHKPITRLYLKENEDFVADQLPLPGVHKSSVHLAEINHDGLTDLLVAGLDSAGKPAAKLLLNDGAGGVLDTLSPLQPLSGVQVLLGDLTGDGNLEIFQTGDSADVPKINYLVNLTKTTNYGPSAASDPQVITLGNRTIFGWAPASDDSTARAGLTYEVFIYGQSSQSFHKTLQSGGISERRTLVAHGGQGPLNTYSIYNLPEGTYDWGVQAIDNAFETRGKKGICQGGAVQVRKACGELTINRKDTAVCAGADLTISLPVKGQTVWYSVHHGFLGSEPDLPYRATHPDTLYAVVYDAERCLYNYALRVDTLTKPRAVASPDVQITAGESVQLAASGGLAYLWKPAEGLSNPAIADPVASPAVTTTYTVTVGNGSVCLTSDSVTVTVIPQPVPPVPANEVFIPTLFTPNQDGNNDQFKVYGRNFASLYLRIYDRAGALVFETRDVQRATLAGWDGTRNGAQLPNGTYFWTLDGLYQDGSPVQFDRRNTGAVNLLR